MRVAVRSSTGGGLVEMVQRSCPGAPPPSCPPDTGGGAGTFFDNERVPEEQGLVAPAPGADEVLQQFDLPSGTNTVFHFWGYLMTASNAPESASVWFEGLAIRDDSGAVQGVSGFAQGSIGSGLDDVSFEPDGAEGVNILGGRQVLETEYCIQVSFAACALQSIVI